MTFTCYSLHPLRRLLPTITGLGRSVESFLAGSERFMDSHVAWLNRHGCYGFNHDYSSWYIVEYLWLHGIWLLWLHGCYGFTLVKGSPRSIIFMIYSWKMIDHGHYASWAYNHRPAIIVDHSPRNQPSLICYHSNGKYVC